MSASPATTITSAIVRPGVRCRGGSPHQRPRAARRSARRPRGAGGNLRDLRRVNRWLGGASLSDPAIDALAAHRARADPPRRRHGRRGHPVALLDRAGRRSRRLSIVGHRQPAGGPRRGRPRPAGGRRERRPRAPRRRRPLAPLPRPLVRCRPRVARAPPPRTGGGRRCCSARWPRRAARRRGQRPRARAARVGRRVADGPPADAATATPGTTRRCRSAGSYRARDGDAPAEGRADAGPGRPRRVRPALRDRRGADGRTAPAARPTRRAPANDRASRHRDRRRRAGGRRRWPPAWPLPGERGRRPRAGAGLALAGRRRVHLAGRGRGPASCRSRRGDAGRGRPADPGDAGRDAGRGRVPPDLRRRRRWRAGRRVRSLGLDPALLELADDVPAPTSGAAGTSTAVEPARRPARRSGDRPAPAGELAARSSSAPTARARSCARAAGVARPARLPRGSGSPTTSPTPTRRRACRDARLRVIRDGYVGIAPVPAAG